MNINKLIKNSLYIENAADDPGDKVNNTLDIIRTMKTVPDHELYFNEIYKQEKATNMHNNDAIEYAENLNIITSSIISNVDFHILSELNLKASLKMYSNCLTIDAFQIFSKVVKDFVRLYGIDIQIACKRVIPFEKFMDDCFQMFYTMSDRNLDKLNALMLHILDDDLRSMYNMFIANYYGEYYGTDNNTLNKKCSICKGCYYE